MDRIDIVEIASEHVSLKQRGRRWVGLCPFHAEKTPSFTVNPELGLFKCFGCGKGGDVFSFVQARENVTFMEAMRILADRAGVELEQLSKGSSGEPTRAELARVNGWALDFFRANLLDETIGRNVRAYVQSRGITEEIAERFNLGLATDGGRTVRDAAARARITPPLLQAADLVRVDDRNRVYDTFRNRLMFPIRDATRRVVGFGGRTLGDDRAKYLNTRQNALFDKGRGLYGIELAREAISRRGRAVVVEGYTDCIAAHGAGFSETVASLGTALTEAQVNLLRRYGEEIILLFDSDEAGEAAAERAILVALPRCLSVRLARIPSGKDPSEFLASAGAEGFSDVLNTAVDALEFKWSRVQARFGGDASDAGRREANLDFLRVVAEAFGSGAVDEIQRGLLANQVAHLLGIDRQEVHRLVGRMLRKRTSGPVYSVSGATTPAIRAGLNKEQSAWVTVLEVLLSEPGALAAVDGLPDPSSITDEGNRRIAALVVGLAKQPGGFRLADVLARCEDHADAERAAELARRGEERGNYEKTLQAAVQDIRSAAKTREVERSKQRLRGAGPGAGSKEDAKDELLTIHQARKEGRHFAPPRLIRHSAGSVEFPTPTETNPPLAG